MMENLVSGAPYLASAATVVQLQRYVKHTETYRRFVQAFPGADKWAHWTFAGVMSLIGATGIHAAATWDVATGGSIHITIPNAANLAHGLWDWFTVYILQHTIYQVVPNKTEERTP